ncbi:MAG: DUF2723 domain-containing protein [Caldilineaceae bacterium]|nr:DUF2723 domain-containing protein [Caldilineaceae bacterium]
MDSVFLKEDLAPVGAWSRLRSASAASLAGWLLWVIAVFVYFATLDTGLLPRELEGGDLITHHYAQVQARPGNAPGYPLYTMGGWLWFHGWRSLVALFGDVTPNPIPILSSYNTLWAILALWLLYRILLILSRSPGWPYGHWPLAWLISAFYAVTYFFWYYATTSEQYSSAIAQTLGIVYVYLRWRQAVDGGRRTADGRPQPGVHPIPDPQSPVPDPQSPIPNPQSPVPNPQSPIPSLLLLACLCGLSLAHMVTVAMIVPPLVAVVLWTQPDLLRRPLTVLGTVLAAALPLLGYIYVYVRGAANPQWWGEGEWTSGRDWFWSFLSTAQGQDELSWGLEPGAPFFANGFPELIWQELSIPLLVIGLLGIALFAHRRGGDHPGVDGRLAFLLYGTLLLYAILCWVDRFGNWFQVILPAYPLILMGVMPAAQWMISRLGRVDARLAALPLILLVGMIGWRVDASLPAADSRSRPEDTALIRPALLLDQPLPADAVLFAEKEAALGLDYLISIWGIRPDLRVVSSPQVDAALAQGGVVLATENSVGLLLAEITSDPSLRLESQTPDWVALFTGADLETSPPQVRLDRVMGDGITLVGYSYQRGPIGAPVLSSVEPSLDLTLYWQVAPDLTPQDWSVSVRPLRGGALIHGADGAPIQQDSAAPVHGLRPFRHLAPTELVADSYRLPGGVELDGLQVVLYRAVADRFENLAVVEWLLPQE